MPFDYEEYERKCKTLPPEALQKEWENYTRQIAGGATSASLSVLFAPVTAGVSTIGLGLSAPRIHNARKKREIIEAQLQAHGTTHHTRKRDVLAPMAISGGIGGLTLGLAGPGANMIAGAAVGHGAHYLVSHVALEAAGASLEHSHVTQKKTKEELKITQKYGSSYESKEKLEDAMAYGFDPQKYPLRAEPRYEYIPVPPPYPAALLGQQEALQCHAQSQQQIPLDSSQQDQTRPQDSKPDESMARAQNGDETAAIKAPALETRPLDTDGQPENDKRAENGDEPQNLPFIGLLHETEADERGLQWDATRGMYVRVEHLNTLLVGGHEFLQASKSPTDELQHLMPQLPVEDGAAHPPNASRISIENQRNDWTAVQQSDSNNMKQLAQLRQYFPPPPPLPATGSQTNNLLSPSGNVQGQGPSLLHGPPANISDLPPRPHSSLENFQNLPSFPPPRPHSSLRNHPDQFPFPLPPPPPLPQPQGYQTQTPQGQYQATASVQPRQIPLTQYSPQLHSPQPYSPQQYMPSLSQASYQSFSPPPPGPQYQPSQFHPQRPNPQPLQQAYNQHRDSMSSISTVSSVSSILSSASTVSPATTPLTGYSTATSSFHNPSQSRMDSITGLDVCASPPQQYLHPPPVTGYMGGISGR